MNALFREVSPVDRFYQSAYDFRTGRPWPPVSSGLNNLWDQVLASYHLFRLV